ncbi:hypothetical protein GTZ99_15105 [Novosphingobium sp. FSY-8]|uniref:Uncharacterized protein n=1 Tax=Novosphingobium ovatum TaxID=1908523 RepID=A0ABW9XH35_9SPHN|nr:hypothetical protein [Novosphingobium ovatum]NBC37882.1 hypothetical protein [Novosphingobium ovatum]
MGFVPRDIVRSFAIGFAVGGLMLAAVYGLSGGHGTIVPAAVAAPQN